MDPSVWKHLPLDVSEKICNLLTKVRSINHLLSDEIKSQWYLLEKYHKKCVTLFGKSSAHYVMYDDIKNVFGIIDDFPEEFCMETVIDEMWKRLEPDQRYFLVYT